MKEIFINACTKFSSDNNLIELLWKEIEKAYGGKKRYYHNLQHLQTLFSQLSPVKKDIENWDAVLFALFYHDIIYDVSKKDNEEKSAALAVKRLSTLGCSVSTIASCRSIILATKGHEPDVKSDVNFFTDADLSILGAAWNQYQVYADNVRKEYGLFPDILYKPGRRKVLERFPTGKQIFKTEFFNDRYEQQAINNLKTELALLS